MAEPRTFSMFPPALETRDHVERLIQERLPESDGLEYKERLELDTQSRKKDLLRDLAGMGNGGGGTGAPRVGAASGRCSVPEVMRLAHRSSTVFPRHPTEAVAKTPPGGRWWRGSPGQSRCGGRGG